mmetsp:Transcript_98610/g.211354  ORF Transcript_98610/g.211354 Transcript_98610/m.211354 type:complete len:228 (+) Transcript_98610:1044-1727(+)
MLMCGVHRLPRIALRPPGEVAEYLRDEELEAKLLLRFMPLCNRKVAIKPRIGHPSIHQPVGHFREAKNAAAATIKCARVTIDTLPCSDECARCSVPCCNRGLTEHVASGRLVCSLHPCLVYGLQPKLLEAETDLLHLLKRGTEVQTHHTALRDVEHRHACSFPQALHLAPAILQLNGARDMGLGVNNEMLCAVQAANQVCTQNCRFEVVGGSLRSIEQEEHLPRGDQ